jgi:hypothetical protein
MKMSHATHGIPNLEHQNSFKGLVAIHYETTGEHFMIDNVVNPVVANLYDRFLMSLIFYDETKPEPMIEKIKTLMSFVGQYPDDKIDVHISTESILYGKKPDSYTDLYYAYRGFLMLCYKPRYKYQEIINKLREEGAEKSDIVLAVNLIGAHLGLKQLITDGLKITPQMQIEIDIALSEYKQYF